MDRTELNAKMLTKLEALGLPYDRINVFGSIRTNVHVRCISRNTASKWHSILCQVFPGARLAVVETVWDAVENKGTMLMPTIRRGFQVSVIGA